MYIRGAIWFTCTIFCARRPMGCAATYARLNGFALRELCLRVHIIMWMSRIRIVRELSAVRLFAAGRGVNANLCVEPLILCQISCLCVVIIVHAVASYSCQSAASNWQRAHSGIKLTSCIIDYYCAQIDYVFLYRLFKISWFGVISCFILKNNS